MSRKGCFSVAYYLEASSYRGMLYFVYLSLCLRRVYSCLIHAICFFTMIFIFITINHITSLMQKNLFFGHVCQKFFLRVLLSFCLIFSQFQPGVTYKNVVYKKACISLKIWSLITHQHYNFKILVIKRNKKYFGSCFYLKFFQLKSIRENGKVALIFFLFFTCFWADFS